MGRRYEETLAELDYGGEVSLNLVAISGPLIERLRARGCDFDAVGTVAEVELQFISRALIVTVMCDQETHSRIRISAETPVGQAPARIAAEMRLNATTAAVSHFTANLPADQVIWQHKGATFVTAPNRKTTVVEPSVRSAMEFFGRAPSSVLHSDAAPTPRKARPIDTSFSPEHHGASSALSIEAEREALARQRATFIDEPASRTRSNHTGGARSDDQRSIPEKCAVYAINTAVMVLSPPVGAGMMTYNLLRGGTVTGNGRALALTGTAMGFATLPATQSLASSAQSLTQTVHSSISSIPSDILAAGLRLVELL